MNYNQYLNLDWLWANKTMVHYFGLGFIQLKLDKSNRVHFYTDKLMKTIGDEEVHNHRYNFVSRILKGTFSQDIYDFDLVENSSDAIHYMVQESCTESDEEELVKILQPVNIAKVYSKTYNEQDSYFMQHQTFHTVASADAVTFLTRSDYKKPLADVIFLKDRETTCPFSIKLTQDEIFDHLKELLEK